LSRLDALLRPCRVSSVLPPSSCSGTIKGRLSPPSLRERYPPFRSSLHTIKSRPIMLSSVPDDEFAMDLASG
jgi:hypothetical protein